VGERRESSQSTVNGQKSIDPVPVNWSAVGAVSCLTVTGTFQQGLEQLTIDR